MACVWDLVWVSIFGLLWLSVSKTLTCNKVIPSVLPFTVQSFSIKHLMLVWLRPSQLLEGVGEAD